MFVFCDSAWEEKKGDPKRGEDAGGNRRGPRNHAGKAFQRAVPAGQHHLAKKLIK